MARSRWDAIVGSIVRYRSIAAGHPDAFDNGRYWLGSECSIVGFGCGVIAPLL